MIQSQINQVRETAMISDSLESRAESVYYDFNQTNTD